MTPENRVELDRLIKERTASLRAMIPAGTLEDRVNFLVTVLATQAVFFDGALDQLQFEVAALRMCLPKADVERAEAAIEQAKRESLSSMSSTTT